MSFPRIASLASPAALRAHFGKLGLALPCDDEALPAPASPLAVPVTVGPARTLANRFVIQPMEGWDATDGGRPSELTRRRWRNFGRSGAAWIWGGEAVAVRADGRANANQLLLTDATAASLGALRRELAAAAPAAEPLTGLQLTHSGRWSRPHGVPDPRIAYRHPLLDARVGVTGDAPIVSDADLDRLIPCFARAAYLAQAEGFDFVDLKHCHGYLLHEFLSARERPGRFGGASLGQREQLMRELIAAIRAAAPGLDIAVRLSVFDAIPHRADGRDGSGRLGRGVPEAHPLPYLWGFGISAHPPHEPELSEPIAFARSLFDLGVRWLNVTAASPYYAPHVQRPAAFPPSDGYAPPEDPVVGVARLLGAARDIKRALPDMIVVSTGWSYLQDYLPHVAQACVRQGWFDAVGLGRMVLAYPELPSDVLAGRSLDRKRLCRTFSDCTTAPRHGLVSGCYPLDPFYRSRPEHETLVAAKRRK